MKTNARKQIVWVAALTLCLAPLCLLAADNAAEVILFNGKDLSGWRKPLGLWALVQGVKVSEANPKAFVFEDGQGVMVNGRNKVTSDILSEFEHGDVEAHIEFCVPKNSNSGVYFMGRYEIQVFDSWGVEKPKYIDCGGIYERWKDDKGYEGHAPKVNASKAPGEWQAFDVIFRAPRFDADGKKVQNAKFIKVVHNGQVVHENVEVTGPTRAAKFENEPEKPLGPLMLQGDHGPVAYRNIRLKPVKLD
jgi:hypothetical protein